MLKPVFSSANAFNPPADLATLADYSEQGGNVRVGTSVARAALPVGERYQMLLWADTTDRRIYMWDGSWKLIGGLTPDARAVRVAAGSYASDVITGLHSVEILDAPAGLYEYSFFGAISSDAATSGELRVATNGVVTTSPVAHDSTASRLLFNLTDTVSHPGGNLAIELRDFRAGTTTGRVAAGLVGTLKFLRPIA